MDRKKLYRELCESEPSVPLFSQAWWLDATAGHGAWDVVLVLQDNRIVASLPFVRSRRWYFELSGQPPLTQSLGPWIRKSQAKYSKTLGREKDLMGELIDQLPPFARFVQNWHWSRTNWLPFYWKGFAQTTRYTYILDDLSDLDALWRGLQDNIRGDIRKAERRFELQVRDDLPIEAFLALNRKTFERQGKPLPYPESLVHRLDAACSARKSRKIFIAEDPKGQHHAGAFVVWDSESAYYLMGGGDPDLRSSGATSLAVWEAIRFASTVSKRFDFEGSMLEPVERFVRGFGAMQVPYSRVSRTLSMQLRLFEGLRTLRAGR